MAAEALAAALEAGALEPTPSAAELALLHLRFDDLRNTSQVEQRALEALRRWERVAIAGPAGSGKSSVIADLAHRESASIAVVQASVTGLRQDQAAEPLHVVQHIVATTRRLAGGRRRPVRAARVKGVEISAGPPWLNAAVALEIQRQARHIPDDLADAADVLQRLLDIISGGTRVPVVVFDDTDRWRAGFGFEDPRALRESFFNRTLRWLAEQLHCAVLVAAHDSYLAGPGSLEAVSDTIRVPALASAGQLSRLITHRLRVTGLPDATAQDLLDGDALLALYEFYSGLAERSLRATLSITRQASQEALDAGLGRVSRHVLLAAMAG